MPVSSWNVERAATYSRSINAYDGHPYRSWLAIPICHLSRFALMGNVYKVYLPVVMRN